MKKIFLLLCLLLFPCITFAAGKISYNFALGHVNNYIYNFVDYEKYLVTTTNKFSFSGSSIGVKNNFVNAGYINLDEYLIAGSVNSYLYDGQDYFTMTDDTNDSNSTYIISHTKLLGYDSIAKSNNTTYTGTRVTEYIAKTTRLNGNGTYQNPWIFTSLDTDGPTLTFAPDGDSTWLKTRNVTVNITDELSNVKKGQTLKYRWQTSNTCSTSMSDYTLTTALSNASADAKNVTATVADSSLAGQYYLCIAAGIEDTKGNASSYARSSNTYYFNNNTPTITSLGTAISESTVNITVNYSSSLQVNQFYYGTSSTSSCDPGTSTSSNTYSYTLSDGSYYVCSKIVDISGNVSNVVSKQITISTPITYAQLIADYSCANGSAGTAPYIMTYGGNCSIVQEGGSTSPNWKVTLSSTGTYNLTFTRNAALNVFLVGGGGGGGAKNSWCAGGGGGGGYTKTINYTITIGTPYPIIVGSGGGQTTAGVGTTAFGTTANGGSGGFNAPSTSVGGPGGAGGSGGGGGGANQAKTNGGTGGNGGAYGNAGSPNNRSGTVVPGGAGQGTTTCEFGEGNLSSCNNGITYSGGGPGGAGQSSTGMGAVGSYGSCTSNYGCGGQGQGTTAGYTSGKQGIVIIRNAR
jgi:hypothetical protein